MTAQIERAAPIVADEDGAKRRQIIEGARRVFLAQGFDAASMGEIAREGRRSGAEDEGGCEGNLGLGQHGRVSFASVNPIDRTVRSSHI